MTFSLESRCLFEARAAPVLSLAATARLPGKESPETPMSTHEDDAAREESEHDHYKFDWRFQKQIVALMFRDPTFLASYHDVLSPTYFSSRDLLRLSEKILRFLLHEFAHEYGGHLDSDYHQGLATLGARLAVKIRAGEIT